MLWKMIQQTVPNTNWPDYRMAQNILPEPPKSGNTVLNNLNEVLTKTNQAKSLQEMTVFEFRYATLSLNNWKTC